MFLETSAPRVRGDKAWLVSQPFPPFSGAAHCFTFWYFMYGGGIGTFHRTFKFKFKFKNFIVDYLL
jgi:hypothetical protein